MPPTPSRAGPEQHHSHDGNANISTKLLCQEHMGTTGGSQGVKWHLQDGTAPSTPPVRLIRMDRDKKKPVSNFYLSKGTSSGIHSRLV